MGERERRSDLFIHGLGRACERVEYLFQHDFTRDGRS
jgi:hypothetical protein